MAKEIEENLRKTKKAPVKRTEKSKASAEKTTEKKSATEKNAIKKTTEKKSASKKTSAKKSTVKKVENKEITKKTATKTTKKDEKKINKAEDTKKSKKRDEKVNSIIKEQLKSINKIKKIDEIQKEEEKQEAEEINKIEQKKKEKQKVNEEEMAEKLEKARKMPAERKSKINKKIFVNIMWAIVATIYLILINLGSLNVEKAMFESDLKVFSLVILAITIIIFEKAYNKDSGSLAIFGIETLVIGIITLISIYVYILHYDMFKFVIGTISGITILYYFVKSIIILIKEIQSWKNNMSDVKEIIEEEQ